MEKYKNKLAMKVDKMYKHQWSLGICLSHDMTETYLYINLFKWSISIGKLSEYLEADNE